MKRRYASPRPRWQTWLAIAVALSVGGGLLWTMRSAFRVGENMMKSVEETRPPPQHRSRSGPSLRARSEAEEAESRAKREAAQPQLKVRGVVKLPPNVPADEELFVVLVHGLDPARVYDRVRPGADGAFELLAPGSTVSMRVGVDAHYLYLDVCLHVDPDALPDSVVLEPKLGGRVLGRLLVPESRREFVPALVSEFPAELEYVERSAEPHRLAGSSSRDLVNDREEDPLRGRPVTLDERFEFELSGVVPDRAFDVHVGYPPASLYELRVRAGETRRVDVPMIPTFVVAGVVLGEKDEPLAGVECSLAGGLRGDTLSIPEALRTNEDGRFAFLSVFDHDTATLSGKLAGFHPAQLALDVDADRSDLVLRLHRVRTPVDIRGRVRWPDGSPAREAWVVAQLVDVALIEPRLTRTDEDGRFEIAHFEGGRTRIVATAREYAAPPESEEEIGVAEVARAGTAAIEWSGVTADAGLELVLTSGATLRGVVVDDAGAPCEHVIVHARPAFASATSLQVLDVAQPCDAASGAFELDTLIPCVWSVTASDGAYHSTESTVDLSQGDAFARVVLSRRPTLTGRVSFATRDSSSVFTVVAGDIGRERRDSGRFRPDEVKGAADGTFQFAHLAAGAYHVHAWSESAGAAEAQAVEIANDAHVSGVELAAARGSLRVELRQDGAPLPRDVELELSFRCPTCGARASPPRAQAAADGTYTFERMSAGHYDLIARDGQTRRVLGAQVVSLAEAQRADAVVLIGERARRRSLR